MDKLLNQIEEIKENLTSQQYKTISDIMMILNNNINDLEKKNKRLNHKIKILCNRYINLSTIFTMIISEREGFAISNVLDVCNCDNSDVDMEYEDYIRNH